jgi:glycine/D-amino acid oxidase-like deaminating enzyme
MRKAETLVVGAGQAGLAMSRCLTEHGADHVVVERGRVAERWRTARWDSLRLITPNWMSRLPAWSYAGADPDGYMAPPELVSHLEGYAGSFAAPLHEGTTVERVEAAGGGLRVLTDQQTWLARNVVVAAGTEDLAYVPSVASGVAPGIHQLPASRYRGLGQLPDGGVLVVGASASGAQIGLRAARRPDPAGPAPGRHHDRDLGDRLPSGLPVAACHGPGSPGRDPPPPRRDRHPRPLRPGPQVPPPAQLQLRRRRGTRCRFVAAHLTRRMTSLALASAIAIAIAPSVALHLT